MENKLIEINNNELELTNEGIKFIKKMQKAKVELAKMEEQLKELFLTNMEEKGIKKYTSPDGTFSATYVAESVSKRFDSKKFKEENQELYDKYLKESTTKSYVKFS